MTEAQGEILIEGVVLLARIGIGLLFLQTLQYADKCYSYFTRFNQRESHFDAKGQ